MVWSVDRSSPSNKIRDLMKWSKDILKDIYYQRKILSSPIATFFTKQWSGESDDLLCKAISYKQVVFVYAVIYDVLQILLLLYLQCVCHTMANIGLAKVTVNKYRMI